MTHSSFCSVTGAGRQLSMFKCLTLGCLSVLVLAATPLEAQITTDAGSALALILYGPSQQGVANKSTVQTFVDMLANGTASFPIATSSGWAWAIS